MRKRPTEVEARLLLLELFLQLVNLPLVQIDRLLLRLDVLLRGLDLLLQQANSTLQTVDFVVLQAFNLVHRFLLLVELVVDFLLPIMRLAERTHNAFIETLDFLYQHATVIHLQETRTKRSVLSFAPYSRRQPRFPLREGERAEGRRRARLSHQPPFQQHYISLRPSVSGVIEKNDAYGTNNPSQFHPFILPLQTDCPHVRHRTLHVDEVPVQVLLRQIRLVLVVPVLVPDAVAQVLHALYRRIADVKRDGRVVALLDQLSHALVCQRHLVRFRGQREIRGAFRQGEVALGNADAVARLVARGSDEQRLRVGQSHIFRCDHQQSSRDISTRYSKSVSLQWILAALDHPPQPVERRLHVAASLRVITATHPNDRFLQRRRHVVVLLAVLVVPHEPLLHRLLHDRLRHRSTRSPLLSRPLVLLRHRHAATRVQQVQRHARIAVRALRHASQHVVTHDRLCITPTSLPHSARHQVRVCRQRATQHRHEIGGRQTVQRDHATPRQQRLPITRPSRPHRVDGEGRVLRRRADQNQFAAFDEGQEDVLLLLVEPVDLVHEQHRRLPRLAKLPLRLLGDGADFLDARRAAGERARGAGGVSHDDGGDGGFAAARRTEEDQRGWRILFQKRAENGARAEEVRVSLAITSIEEDVPRRCRRRRGAGVRRGVVGRS